MSKISINDFQILDQLGHGSFGSVKLVRRKSDNKDFALKIVSKSHLKSENKKHQAIRQRNFLTQTRNHPGITTLYNAFQDQQNLFYLMQYCSKGDLYQLLQRYGNNIPYQLARIYAAQLVVILQFLRKHQIIHRDLKPSNILISDSNHLKLTDFGSAKGYQANSHTGTFVGTADYVSPQMLDGGQISYSVDLWALGCIIYEMLVGKPPFSGGTEYLTFQNIRVGQIEFPESMPPFAQQLVQALVLQDPQLRIGAEDIEILKQDIFFQGIDFENLFSQSVPDISSMNIPISVQQPSVLMSGIVKKKAGWVYRKRLLIISDQPRISYYEPTRDEYRGDIAISAELTAEVKGKVEFHIVTPRRTYYFKELGENPQVWVNAVLDMVRRTYQGFNQKLGT